MKGKHFYSHLVEINEIYLSLSGMDLSEDERGHLLSLAETNIHATVINTVLSELSEEDKKIFLKNLVAEIMKKLGNICWKKCKISKRN